MEENTEKIRSVFVNQSIKSLQLYNLNESYMEFIPGKQWVIDGGIELCTEAGRLSFAYDTNNMGFDYSLDKNVLELIDDEDAYLIEIADKNYLNDILGQTIQDVELKWGFFHEFDEEGQVCDEKIYVPEEVLLKFSNEKSLQLSLINFQVHHEAHEIVNPEYNLAGNLLVNLNSLLAIHSEEGELSI